MFLLVQDLFSIFTRSQRRRLLMLQALMVLMAFAEIGGVSAIGVFMAVVADPNILVNAGSFGTITDTRVPPRIVQLGIKYYF